LPPLWVRPWGMYKYYLVLLNDFTHYAWTFPLRNKSDVPPILRSFHSYICTQFGLPWLALQTDNGREFDNYALRSFFSANSVALRLSCPHTSQQNGKAERVLQTLNDCMRTLLFHSAAPTSFWAEALATATFLVNRRPCRATGTTTPFQLAPLWRRTLLHRPPRLRVPVLPQPYSHNAEQT
jgi:transposase InsO family protein